MKFSAKARYGLRAVQVLATNYCNQNREAISSSRLAVMTGVSEPYLEKIMAMLSKCGVVSSSLGSTGGYILNHCPAEITVGRVLKVLEGPLFLSECVDGCDNKTCPNKDVFSAIYNRIDDVLEGMTLAEMLNNKEKK